MKTIFSLLRSIKNHFLGSKTKIDYLNKGERYDPNIADHFDQCHVSRYDFVLDYIGKKDKVIDIACGTGWGSNILSKKCDSVVGVDISKDAIKFARRRYSTTNARFVLSDFFQFYEKADVVVSFETLEHIKANLFQDVLIKILSLSKALIIGSVPYEEIPGNNKYHVSYLLNEASFSFLQLYGDISFFYQSSNGIIHKTKESIKTQNLIFVFRMK